MIMSVDATVDRVIRAAIADKRLLAFRLDGLERIAEPHDYGVRNGRPMLFVYQLEGGSRSGRLPDWRLVTVANVSHVRMLERTFGGPRIAPTGKHLVWDELWASVSRPCGVARRDPTADIC